MELKSKYGNQITFLDGVLTITKSTNEATYTVIGSTLDDHKVRVQTTQPSTFTEKFIKLSVLKELDREMVGEYKRLLTKIMKFNEGIQK